MLLICLLIKHFNLHYLIRTLDFGQVTTLIKIGRGKICNWLGKLDQTFPEKLFKMLEIEEMMTDTLNEIGLAIIGCGTIGRIRAKFAREYPGVKWLGLCDVNDDLGKKLEEDTNADFYTNDFNELINRPEVNAVMIITDENKHTEPTLAAVERGHKLFIEKPLATEARDSLKILNAIEEAGLDACVGYTNRFRRRFLTVKERLMTGQIGDVHTVTTRAFMNRMVPIATIAKTNARHNLTPMVVS